MLMLGFLVVGQQADGKGQKLENQPLPLAGQSSVLHRILSERGSADPLPEVGQRISSGILAVLVGKDQNLFPVMTAFD